MDWATLRDLSLSHERRQQPPLRLVRIDEYGPLWTAEEDRDDYFVRDRTPLFETLVERLMTNEALTTWRESINARLAASKHKDIYVFVHGFNTSLDECTIMAGSLWHFLGRDGAMVCFSWPSRGSAFAYSVDKASARASVLPFQLLLWLLHDQTDAERIHILAHSAGSPIVVSALQQIRLRYHDMPYEEIIARSKFGQLVLAAPDMDLMRFRHHLFDGFDQVPEQVTIYVSTDDGALGFSAGIFEATRLGDPIEALKPDDLRGMRRSDTITAIDVAEAHRRYGSFLGHSYFHHNPWVSSDLMMVLRHGASAEQRGLLRGPEDGFWTFPADYDVVAPERARTAYGQEPPTTEEAETMGAAAP